MIVTSQTEYAYYDWLVSQIEVPVGRTYNYLFERMHNLEFVWTIPHDDNRVRDAVDLRTEFMNGRHRGSISTPISILEVLIALSRRTEFTAGGKASVWAWRLIKNLKLNKMSDPVTDEQANKIDDILDALVWRTYQRDGRGGFFPLKDSLEDQTKLELWYQMNLYVMELENR